MHERFTPNLAVQFAKAVEPLRLFFLEDPLSPEDIAYFRQIRQQCATPIAMGELFNSPHEWTPLISERLIDYIRIHVSQAGGFTPCRKIAAMGEIFGVRTAWHGPATSRRSAIWRTHARRRPATTSEFRSTSAFDERTREVSTGSRIEERVRVSERQTRMGHRSGREDSGEVPPITRSQ